MQITPLCAFMELWLVNKSYDDHLPNKENILSAKKCAMKKDRCTTIQHIMVICTLENFILLHCL